MKPQLPADLANDNGKSEDHLAAATMALREAIKGQDDPGKMVKAILDLTRPAGAISRTEAAGPE